ncbi:MAG: hypothetical protein GY729_14655 [Desulfobacteraceae bacterium]|nr:hypothetical protein [Desulfobacteraceae bacterium]
MVLGRIFHEISAIFLTRKALKKDGIVRGSSLFDCTKCGCHYSAFDKKSGKYSMPACGKAKEEYVRQFLSKSRTA